MNIENRRIYHSDNIDILRGIDSNTVDLIYLDPPFNKNDTFIGSTKRISEIKAWFIKLQWELGQFQDVDFNEVFKENPNFKDIWNYNDIQKEHYGQIDNFNHELINYFDSVRKSSVTGTFYYLVFMTIRLIEMHRILKDTGSIYLHCDSTMSHYLKIIMDKIFGHGNFKNNIIWWYGGGGASKLNWGKKHDDLLFYTKKQKYTFNVDKVREEYKWTKGQKRADGSNRDLEKGKLPDDVFHFHGLMPWAKEATGYPTQKPLVLLERIIEASSNEGDIVLDPFCGCATTCIAAERLGRQWVGIDWNRLAYYMIYYRANAEGIGTVAQLDMFKENLLLKTAPPIRTDAVEHELFYKVKSKVELKGKKHSEQIDPQYRKEALDLLYEEQVGMCNGCDQFLRKADLTVDHIKPKKDGVNHDIDNLQLLCYRCNNWKRVGTMVELIQKLYNSEIIKIGIAQKQMKQYNGTLQAKLRK